MFRLVRDLTAFVVGVIEVLLIFRFILRLLSANPSANFVGWIYETSYPLLRPFLFAFPTPSVTGGFALEFSTLFAIFAYAFIGYVLQELLEILANSQSSKRKG